MDSLPVTNKAAGEPLSWKSTILDTGAAMTQVSHISLASSASGAKFG